MNVPEWFKDAARRCKIAPEHVEIYYKVISNDESSSKKRKRLQGTLELSETKVLSDRGIRRLVEKYRNIEEGRSKVSDALDKTEYVSTPSAKLIEREESGTEPINTGSLSVIDDVAQLSIKVDTTEITDDLVHQEMLRRGLDPEKWVVTGFKSSEWSIGRDHTGTALAIMAKKRVATSTSELKGVIESLAQGYEVSKSVTKPSGGKTLLIGVADLQIGKADGGKEVTAEAVGAVFRKTAEAIAWGKKNGCDKVHLSLLGDCIEGFVSQKGSNAWRTTLTLTEQLALVRAIFFGLYRTIRDEFSDVTIASVPGNHGEPQRFGGLGVTRYDDSHDTDCLLVVAEAAKMAGDTTTRFQVPDTDELNVISKVGDLWVLQTHGHKIARHDGIDWWRKQAFHNPAASDCTLLLSGHSHHFKAMNNGDRLWVQCPALESESTWWRHKSGDIGAPGIVGMVVDETVEDIRKF